MAERRDLLAEVREKEHATQRSVYHLEGMVGKLVEMRDFTGAFFNKISYLDTKLPVSQRRLALWMDKLQALQSQWLGTIGRYMVVYAPSGIRGRFIDWERHVQIAAMKARELRGEVGDIQLGGAPSPPTISTTATSASTAGSSSTAETSPIVGTSTARFMPMPSAASLGPLGLFSRNRLKRPSGDSPSHGGGSSYMVTPQSLMTEGKDSEKDVRQYLQRRATDHESLYGIEGQEDDSTAESLMSTSSRSGSNPMYSSQHQ